jgi:hypothetical protein
MMAHWFADIETDGLLDEVTKLHCAVFQRMGGDAPLVATDEQELRSILDQIEPGDTIWWHNMFGFDLPCLHQLFGIEYSYSAWAGKKVSLYDTLAISRALWPDRPWGNGLEAWGEKLGIAKPQIGDWKHLSTEQYIHRCKEDVRIQEALVYRLAEEGKYSIDNLPKNLRMSNITYYLMCEQERNGVGFDSDLAKQVVAKIDRRMAEIENIVHPQLPKKTPGKGESKALTPPKLQFKKDGTPSAHAEKWFDKLEQRDDGWYGTRWGITVKLPCHRPLTDKVPMELKDQAAIKEWLMELGWKPTIWNVKKEMRNGKLEVVRDNRGREIKTSPKFHNMSGLCPNLEKLGDKVEIVRLIIEWLSLRNRRSVVLNEEKGTGWLNHPRLIIDGRLPACSSGLTNTHRQKHRIVANIPKVGERLGEEMRSLFCAKDGNVLVGYDASGLEARVEAHFTYKYDNGAYAKEILEGDVHTTNAKVFFGEDIPLDEDGKAVKEYRNPAKSGKYALTYGAQPARLAETLGIPVAKAEEVYENFWEANMSLRALKDNLERFWEGTGKKYILTIDKSKVYTRAKHSLVNALFQSTGAKIMDLAGCILAKWIEERGIPAKRVIYYHDEYAWECPPEWADEVGRLGVESIKQAGRVFKLRVPLDAEYKVGKTWAEIH